MTIHQPIPANDDSMVITIRAQEPNRVLMNLLLKPTDLTLEEWAFVEECSAQHEYDLLINAGLSHEEALEISGGVK